MISKKVGIVESIKSSDDNLEDIRVNVSGQIQRIQLFFVKNVDMSLLNGSGSVRLAKPTTR